MSFEPLEIQNWDYYKLHANRDDEINPFHYMEIQGSHLHPRGDQRHLFDESDRDRIGTNQIILYDTYDFYKGSKSAKIRAIIKNGYRVKMCFRVASYTTHSLLYIRKHAENQTLGTFHARCITQKNSSTSYHPKLGSRSFYHCHEITFEGDDEIEFDIDSNYTGEHQSTGNVFAIRVNGVHKYELKDNLDENLIITIINVERSSDPSPSQNLQEELLAPPTSIFALTENDTIRSNLISAAMRYTSEEHRRFRYGGNTPPPLGSGTDCSGFVLFVLKEIFQMNWRDMTSTGISRMLPRTRKPRPGDLVFFRNSKGAVNHVDFYLGEVEGQEKVLGSFGSGSNPGVGIRDLSSMSQLRFFCTIEPLINKDVSIKDHSLNSLTFPISEETEVQMNSESQIKVKKFRSQVVAVQRYLYSQGLFSGQTTGIVGERTINGINALQDLMIMKGTKNSENFTRGVFDHNMLNDIRNHDLEFNLEQLTLLDTYHYYNPDAAPEEKRTSIMSYYNPYEFFDFAGDIQWHTNGCIELLSRDTEGSDPDTSALYLKILPGWSLKFELSCPPNFLQDNTADRKHNPNVGDCYNKEEVGIIWNTATASTIELELIGGDELLLCQQNFNHWRRKGYQFQDKYKHEKFYIKAGGVPVTQLNCPQPQGQIYLKLLDIKPPNGDWVHYTSGEVPNFKRGITDSESLLDAITKDFKISKKVNELNSENDTLEIEVAFDVAVEVKVLAKSNIKITKMAHGAYKMETGWTVGVGFEFGSTKFGWGAGSKGPDGEASDALLGAGGGASAEASASESWESAYIFESIPERSGKDQLIDAIPYAILSVGYLYSPLVAFTVDAATGFSSSDAVAGKKTADKIIFSTDASAEASLGVNLAGLGAVSTEAKIGGSIARRFSIENDYTASNTKFGLEFEIAGSASASSSIGLPITSEAEDGDMGAHLEEFNFPLTSAELFAWNLSRAMKVEASLGSVNWNSTKSPKEDPGKMFRNSQGKFKASNVKQNLGLSNVNDSTLLDSLKVTTYLSGAKYDIEVEIEFQTTAGGMLYFASQMMSFSHFGVFKSLLAMKSANLPLQNLALKIYKREKKSTEIGAKLKIAGVGFSFGLKSELFDRTEMIAKSWGPSSPLTNDDIKDFKQTMDKKLQMLMKGGAKK